MHMIRENKVNDEEYKRQYEGEVLVCANLAQTVSNEGEQTSFHRRRGGR